MQDKQEPSYIPNLEDEDQAEMRGHQKRQEINEQKLLKDIIAKKYLPTVLDKIEKKHPRLFREYRYIEQYFEYIHEVNKFGGAGPFHFHPIGYHPVRILFDATQGASKEFVVFYKKMDEKRQQYNSIPLELGEFFRNQLKEVNNEINNRALPDYPKELSNISIFITEKRKFHFEDWYKVGFRDFLIYLNRTYYAIKSREFNPDYILTGGLKKYLYLIFRSAFLNDSFDAWKNAVARAQSKQDKRSENIEPELNATQKIPTPEEQKKAKPAINRLSIPQIALLYIYQGKPLNDPDAVVKAEGWTSGKKLSDVYKTLSKGSTARTGSKKSVENIKKVMERLKDNEAALRLAKIDLDLAIKY
jgi:hypothetical protein